MTDITTRQQLFDYIVTHLRTQNRRAVGSDMRCRYRAPDGLRCAVGCLFGPDVDTFAFEGATVSAAFDPDTTEGGTLRSALCAAVPFVRKDTKAQLMLAWMQSVHDTGDDPLWTERPRRNLRSIAKEYGVSAREVDREADQQEATT